MTTIITVGVFENTLKIRFADGPTRYYKTLSKQLVGKFYATHWDEKRKRIVTTQAHYLTYFKYYNNNNSVIVIVWKNSSRYRDWNTIN
jgi:hypothetical protein